MAKNNKSISDLILKFCKPISTEEPVFVPLRPVVSEPLNECFTVVPEHISRCGGKQKLGWCIHVWRNVLIEAEFHCVWESPEGELIDISPKIYEIDSIIFLPDPAISYTGRQVDNIRKPIAINKKVDQYIRLMSEYFEYVNKGDLADHYGQITIGEDFIDKYNLMVELEKKITRKFGKARGITTGSGFVNYHLKPQYKSKY